MKTDSTIESSLFSSLFFAASWKASLQLLTFSYWCWKLLEAIACVCTGWTYWLIPAPNSEAKLFMKWWQIPITPLTYSSVPTQFFEVWKGSVSLCIETCPSKLRGLVSYCYGTKHLIRLVGIFGEAAISIENRWVAEYVMDHSYFCSAGWKVCSQTKVITWMVPHRGVSAGLTGLKEVSPDLWNPTHAWLVCFLKKSICTPFHRSPSNNDINKILYNPRLQHCLSCRGGLFHAVPLTIDMETAEFFEFFFLFPFFKACVPFFLLNVGKEEGKALPS